MLRMTLGLAGLVLVCFALSRMSCFAQNGISRIHEPTEMKFTDVALVSRASAFKSEKKPKLAPQVDQRVDEIFGSELAVVPEVASRQLAKTEYEFVPLSAPIVSTPMIRDLPAQFPVDQAETTDDESTKEISWQEIDPFSPPPPQLPQAQDSDLELLSEGEEAIEATETEEISDSDDEQDESGWRPKFNVILNQPAESAPSASIMMNQEPFVTNRPIPERNRSEPNAPGYRSRGQLTGVRYVHNIVGGVTLIRCDDIYVHVSHGDDGSLYEFDISGHLELRNASVTIEAESASLKDGQLTLKTITLQSPHTTLTSDEVSLDLDVTSLRVGDPIKVKTNELQPTPASVFQPAANNYSSGTLSSGPTYSPFPQNGSKRKGTIRMQ